MENTLSALNDKESMHHDYISIWTYKKVLMKKASPDKKAWEYKTNQQVF